MFDTSLTKKPTYFYMALFSLAIKHMGEGHYTLEIMRWLHKITNFILVATCLSKDEITRFPSAPERTTCPPIGARCYPLFCWVSIKALGPYPTKMKNLIWLAVTETWVDNRS